MVTGGSQGLGEAMAIEFAKKGADVVIVSRSEEKLKKALEKIEVHLLGSLVTEGCSNIS
jgi:short-subunit dehydrogenase